MSKILKEREQRLRVEGFRIAGKTGTAEGTKEQTTWFASFGPIESPRYAVIVMVQAGSSGGGTCAPVAVKFTKTILKLEQARTARAVTLATSTNVRIEFKRTQIVDRLDIAIGSVGLDGRGHCVYL